MVLYASLLGTRYSGLDFGGGATEGFRGAVPLLPTAPSGVDGSDVEDKFHIFWGL